MKFNTVHNFGMVGAIFMILLWVAIIGGTVWLTVASVKEVNKYGLKHIIERIWEGPEVDAKE